ncbi:MAG: sigma 54-interacting transcriptional regulator, partial [Planctomycetota bacterium]
MGLFLLVECPGAEERRVSLGTKRTTVGRHPDCDLVITDPHASRRQLVLEQDGTGRCRLKDLGSKNPAQVNGKRVRETLLRPGDRIKIGNTVLVLRRAPEAGEEEGGAVTASSVRLVETPADEQNTRLSVSADDLTSDDVTALLRPAPEVSHLRDRLEAFYKLAEVFARASEADALFGRILDCLFEAIPAERGFVAIGDPRRGTFQVVRVRNDRGEEDSVIEMSQTILDEIQLKRSAMLVEDAPKLASKAAQSILRLGIRTFLCAPMFVGEDFLGVIYLDQIGEGCTLTEEDLSFLQGVTRLCALAIDDLQFHERLRGENLRLRAILERKRQIIAESPAMLEILQKLPRVGERETPVLINGETGTGKELIARAIHTYSPRCEGPFVAFNCATSSPALIESELFGHVKGAFTDATRDHRGKFELADGGTLFLDEIGEMPLGLQVKMLRASQERAVEPIGGEKTIPVDIRIISATHRNLERLREENRFREDLFYRLAVLKLDLPPLRDRGDDIIEIARSLLPEGLEIDEPVRKALLGYSWPGNVRELETA